MTEDEERDGEAVPGGRQGLATRCISAGEAGRALLDDCPLVQQ